MSLSLIFFLTLACAGLTSLVDHFCRKQSKTVQRRLGRSRHSQPPTSEGGLAFLMGLILCLLASGFYFDQDILLSIDQMKWRHLGLALSVTMVWVLGRIGDARNFDHRIYFLALSAGSLLMLAFGFRIETVRIGEEVHSLGWLSVPGTLLWFIVISEFFRLFDGLDGVQMSIVGLAIGLQLWVLFPEEGYARLLCQSALPALLGLLPWRIYPARMELRGIGAFLPGFVFGAITLVGRQKAFTTKAVLAPILVLFAVLALFALWVLEQRVFLPRRDGRSAS